MEQVKISKPSNSISLSSANSSSHSSLVTVSALHPPASCWASLCLSSCVSGSFSHSISSSVPSSLLLIPVFLKGVTTCAAGIPFQASNTHWLSCWGLVFWSSLHLSFQPDNWTSNILNILASYSWTACVSIHLEAVGYRSGPLGSLPWQFCDAWV